MHQNDTTTVVTEGFFKKNKGKIIGIGIVVAIIAGFVLIAWLAK